MGLGSCTNKTRLSGIYALVLLEDGSLEVENVLQHYS